MKLNISSNVIHEILKLSKAKNISFINKQGVTYIVANDQTDEKFLNQIIKKVDSYSEEIGNTVIDKNVLKMIPKDENIKITENKIICSTRKIEYKPNEAVDQIIKVDNYLTDIHGNEMKELLSCSYAINKTDERPALNGICINDGEFAAVDGFRLSIRKGNFHTALKIIASKDLINVIKKIKYDDEIKVYYNEKFVKFQFGNLEVIGNRQSGEFLKYENILHDEYTTKLKINTDKFVKILKEYKKNKFNPIGLNIEKDKFYIKAKNEITSIQDTIEADIEGDPLKIYFNVNYLIEALNNYINPVLKMTNKLAPLIIREGNKLDLVLPIRMVNDD